MTSTGEERNTSQQKQQQQPKHRMNKVFDTTLDQLENREKFSSFNNGDLSIDLERSQPLIVTNSPNDQLDHDQELCQ
ncbi:hypothetical protein QYF36_000778 [Acer negundo]|nr:hypothetical protein QYF36_000778 [Acer negundo]